jgi:hypothetical protein
MSLAALIVKGPTPRAPLTVVVNVPESIAVPPLYVLVPLRTHRPATFIVTASCPEPFSTGRPLTVFAPALPPSSVSVVAPLGPLSSY